MIVCNNCGRKFRDDSDLAFCITTDNGDGTKTTKLYTVGDYGDYDETKDEIFRGCPNCLTDEALMDVEQAES